MRYLHYAYSRTSVDPQVRKRFKTQTPPDAAAALQKPIFSKSRFLTPQFCSAEIMSRSISSFPCKLRTSVRNVQASAPNPPTIGAQSHTNSELARRAFFFSFAPTPDPKNSSSQRKKVKCIRYFCKKSAQLPLALW